MELAIHYQQKQHSCAEAENHQQRQQRCCQDNTPDENTPAGNTSCRRKSFDKETIEQARMRAMPRGRRRPFNTTNIKHLLCSVFVGSSLKPQKHTVSQEFQIRSKSRYAVASTQSRWQGDVSQPVDQFEKCTGLWVGFISSLDLLQFYFDSCCLCASLALFDCAENLHRETTQLSGTTYNTITYATNFPLTLNYHSSY